MLMAVFGFLLIWQLYDGQQALFASPAGMIQWVMFELFLET